MPVGGGTSAQGAFMVSVLKSLGYRARLRLVPPNKYFPGIMDSRLRMQAGFHGWASDYPSESGFLQRLFTCADFTRRSPERTSDPSEFCDRSIDRQIARAEAVQAQDPPAASVLWQQVERDVLARAPIVPTANPKRVDFISKRVANYQFHPQWGALLDQLWLR
jgi:peptide/nickel transport system substrate-binding protein